ncbi:hypothetical protein MP228_012319 [Amoeboaphelidium protococcarum]|nr:hypothetical protein MP228_012319 [Amoeboaphelidium protococcarum]
MRCNGKPCIMQKRRPFNRSPVVLVCKGRCAVALKLSACILCLELDQEEHESQWSKLNTPGYQAVALYDSDVKSARMLAVSQKFIQMTELNVAWLRVSYQDLRSQLDYAAEIDKAFQLIKGWQHSPQSVLVVHVEGGRENRRLSQEILQIAYLPNYISSVEAVHLLIL